MSFYSRPKFVLKKWKVYATHKDELTEFEINDYNRIMTTLKKAPKPLLQFIHSFFYEHAEIVEAHGFKRHVGSAYTNKLMKYDDYCEKFDISRHEFNRLMTKTCLLMYEHYFKETKEEYTSR